MLGFRKVCYRIVSIIHVFDIAGNIEKIIQADIYNLAGYLFDSIKKSPAKSWTDKLRSGY